MFRTQLHERDPFRAIFAYVGTLSGLDPKQVRGNDAARGVVRKFVNEVDVGARAILNLADPSIRQAIGVDGKFLRQSWKHAGRRAAATTVLGLCSGCHGGRVAGSVRALRAGVRNEFGTLAME
jgi:hypothetical protein